MAKMFSVFKTLTYITGFLIALCVLVFGFAFITNYVFYR